MNETNQKIIDAIIEKANRICPDSLALIGVYGSVATGDDYEKSDLDLLILIKDDAGWQLGTGFILDDTKVGYDIYCTNWDGLQYESECHHAQLSKLMESKIVYVKDQRVYDEYLKLREKTSAFLKSEQRLDRVSESVNQAKVCYADMLLSDEIGAVRRGAFGVICHALDAIMLFDGDYFKRGTKRTFVELAEKNISQQFVGNIKQITESTNLCEMRECAKEILLYVQSNTYSEKTLKEVSDEIAGELKGTYEEMFSNWRNKVEEAARNQDSFASFMNLNHFEEMFAEIISQMAVDDIDIMEAYDPNSLDNNLKLYDQCLDYYQEIYKKAAIEVVHYKNVDEFVNSWGRG